MKKLQQAADDVALALRNMMPADAPAPAIKSPGRKAMAQELKGKRVKKKLWHMRGANIPQAVEEDKMFFQLFQMSKDLEKVVQELKDETIPDIAAITAARDAFNEALNAVRVRWLELVPEGRPS